MNTILYPFFAILLLMCSLITCILSPFLALLADKDGNLPKWLYLFQTFDHSLDWGWKGQGCFGTYLIDKAVPTGVTLWWYRVEWMLRNSGYGFAYYLFGVKFDSSEWTVIRNDNKWWIAKGPNGAFCVKHKSDMTSLKLGWKAWAYWQFDENGNNGQWKDSDYKWGPERRVPLCFTPLYRSGGHA